MAFKIPNLDLLWNNNPLLAEALQAVRDGIDQLGTKLSINPQGPTIAPAAPSALNVIAANGISHVTLTDNNPRTRQVHYFVEWDTSPSFNVSPQTHHLGVGRQIRVPTAIGGPVYWRAYSMYPDGQRSPIVYHGSPTAPLGVNDGAISIGPAPPRSTGSGTSPRAGQGFGTEHFISSPTAPGKPPKTF
jgi:hypothetical protein